MVSAGAGDAAKAENFLKTVEILSPLTDAQRASLAEAMEESKFGDGEYVISNPDPDPTPTPNPSPSPRPNPNPNPDRDPNPNPNQLYDADDFPAQLERGEIDLEYRDEI